MPLHAFLIVGSITLGVAALAAWLHSPNSTDAHIVPGEYSMEVDVAPSTVGLGGTFVARVGISHNESAGFSGVQWHLSYDDAVLSVLSMNAVAGAAPECVFTNNSVSRVLLGCLTFVPGAFNFDGDVFEVTFRCDSEASTALVIETSEDVVSPSSVQLDSDTYFSVHGHSESVSCSSAVPTSPPAPTPTATPPVVPTGATYHLQVDAPHEAEVGQSFIVSLRMLPEPPAPYRVVQWLLNYDAGVVPIQAVRDAAAPVECSQQNLFEPGHVTLACSTVITNGLSYAGTAWLVTFECSEAGTVGLALGTGPLEGSIVVSGQAQVDDPIYETTTINSVTINCVEPLLFNGLAKSIDGELPADGEETTLRNVWLCYDQATDGIDNDGDSTIDEEPATCDANGEGELLVEEWVAAHRDCDTRNDDDDGDGRPVDGSVADGSNTPYVGTSPRPECSQPRLEDFIQDEVDKDGGEEPEGLGAIEFQLKFDHKIFDITVTESDDESDAIDNDGDTLIDEDDEDWANGRFANCSMMIISENDIRFGCVTSGPGPGHFRPNGISVASIRIVPEADLAFRIRPGKDNGVVRRILQENCEVADIFGDIFPRTNAGLTPTCSDLDLTVRRLEGDLDSDCDVTVTDAQRIAFRYGSFFGQLLYSPHYDLEPFVAPDFDIDIKDLQFVFGRVGSTCAAPVPNSQDPVPANGVGQP